MGNKKKGLREKEGLIDMKLRGRERKHIMRRMCHISGRMKCSHHYGFTSRFPLTSEHLRGHVT